MSLREPRTPRPRCVAHRSPTSAVSAHGLGRCRRRHRPKPWWYSRGSPEDGRTGACVPTATAVGDRGLAHADPGTVDGLHHPLSPALRGGPDLSAPSRAAGAPLTRCVGVDEEAGTPADRAGGGGPDQAAAPDREGETENCRRLAHVSPFRDRRGSCRWGWLRIGDRAVRADV